VVASLKIRQQADHAGHASLARRIRAGEILLAMQPGSYSNSRFTGDRCQRNLSGSAIISSSSRRRG
jgi:hypothetical protein